MLRSTRNPAVPSRSSELAYAPVQPRELATAGPAFGAPPRTGAISPNLEPVASYASPVQTSRDPESMQVPLERQHMTARQAEAGSVVDQAGVVHATDHTGAPSSAAAIDRVCLGCAPARQLCTTAAEPPGASQDQSAWPSQPI